jgi:hypothetical protein
MAFFGPALLLMRITLDAKYGIYPTMLLCRGISCVRARCPVTNTSPIAPISNRFRAQQPMGKVGVEPT